MHGVHGWMDGLILAGGLGEYATCYRQEVTENRGSQNIW